MKKLLHVLVAVCAVNTGVAQTWMQRTNFPGDGRHRATAFSIGNRGYLGMGHVNGNNATINYNDWWEYDPASDSWTQRANFPTVNYGAIFFSAGNKGYCGGGAFLANQFYEYDPQLNTWTPIANCPTTPGDMPAFSVNGKGYVIQSSQIYEYDPATDTWTQKQNAPVAFGIWCSAFTIGSSGYVRSGVNFYEYKPAQNQWIARAPFPGISTNGSIGVRHESKGYIVSGYVGALSTVTDEVWEYDPGNNTWTRIGDFPGTSRRFSVGFTINNTAYLGTGTNGINLNDLWMMNHGVGVGDCVGLLQSQCYPVPAEDVLTISVSSEDDLRDCRVYVTTIDGRAAGDFALTNNRCAITRNELASGAYFYSIRNSTETLSTGKFIFR